MSSVLHVSSGAITPVVAPTFSRFCSACSSSPPAASSSTTLAALPRLAGLRQLKSPFLSEPSNSSRGSSSIFKAPSTGVRIVSGSSRATPGAAVSPSTSNFSSATRKTSSPSPSPSPSPSLTLSLSGSSRRGLSMPRSCWLSKLGLGGGNHRAAQTDAYNNAALGSDDDKPAAGQQFATFGAGCFWGVELAFQRVPGVAKTEVGYSQGLLHDPTYGDVCDGDTLHSEVVRVEFDPARCPYESLLEVFWRQHDPTTLNRQGGDRGTQYRSGIYFYTSEQEKVAKESAQKEQETLNNKIVTEILPAKKFYRAEEYHQQYLAKGGRYGFKQNAAKGCNDPIRCYG